ncbi:MAG: UDP-N-acetylmuramoyl-L-alanine--D-glutamate ligase [Burkholderiaceae bacterium]|jgi:UDP-N-acetylmuramoylalanine--D-glutamate ligase
MKDMPTVQWPCPESGWQGLRALVVGAGESGCAMADWLQRRGADVLMVDSRTEQPIPQGLRVQWQIPTPFPSSLLDDRQMLALSPGLSPHSECQSPLTELLNAAEEKGLTVVGELDLFDWALSHLGRMDSAEDEGKTLALDRPPVVAVTGTNGKTTTARLTAHLLRAAGMDVQEAGNQGPSLLRGLLEREALARWPQVWVLELSSFQLALAHRFTPTVATVLNLSQDHLDWHPSMQDYLAAKLRVFGIGQPSPCAMVVNRGEEALLAAIEALRPKTKPRPMVSFGIGPASSHRPGFGLLHQGIEWIAHWPEDPELKPQRLVPIEALRITGGHNSLNAMAALGLAMQVSPELAPMLHALTQYCGEPHRMQSVAEIDSVEFINDSKGTNTGATMAALRGTSGPIAVILGGLGKSQDFSGLVRLLSERRAHVVTIGQAGPEIGQACQQAGLQVQSARSLDEAVSQAWHWARDYSVQTGARVMVLLSPACASFDMFDNYIDRGQTFAQAVTRLAEREGQPC